MKKRMSQNRTLTAKITFAGVFSFLVVLTSFSTPGSPRPPLPPLPEMAPVLWSERFDEPYAAGERMETIVSGAGAFDYGYSAANPASSLVRTLRLPNFASITNHFDSLSRLDYTALVDVWGHPLDGYGYTHDPLGLRTNIVRHLGITTNSVAVGYDAAGQLTSWKAKESSGTARLNEQLDLVFDKAGNLSFRTNGGLVQTFTNDAANQLTGISRTGTLTVSGATPAPASSVTVNGQAATAYGDLSFARAGNTLLNGNNTFTIAAQNQFHSATNALTVNLPSSVNLTWDANGNLTSDGTRTFQYDAENRLVTNFVASAWKAEFVYDGLGRRRIERDYGWTGSWSKTNELHFIYDGMLLVQIRDASNNVLETFTRGLDFSGTLQGAGGIGGLLARTDGSGSEYYHADGAGNITALIDSAQVIQARYEYSPFGRPIGKWGPLADENEMQFSSMPVHRLSGIVGFVMRPTYDPTLQRFLSRDPIGELGGINLYGYADNSPISYVDPWGLQGAQLEFDFEREFEFEGEITREIREGLARNRTPSPMERIAENADRTSTRNLMRQEGLNPELSYIGPARQLRPPTPEELMHYYEKHPFRSLNSECPKEPGVAAEGTASRNLLAQGSLVTDSSRLLPGVSGSASDIVVIGRQVDTAVAENWAGYKTLNIQNWTLQANDNFIQAAINQRQTFYLGSPVNYQTLWNPARNSMTVFGRELGQIYQAGYQQSGLYLIPPHP